VLGLALLSLPWVGPRPLLIGFAVLFLYAAFAAFVGVRRPAKWILVGLAVLFVASALFGGGADGLRAVTSGRTTGTHTVWYYVEGRGNARGSVTYTNAEGGTQQETEVKFPWEKYVGEVPRGTFLYLSALNKDPDFPGVTVRIVVDNNKFRESESTGTYASATASARCC
jgi:hypothetical protein